MGNLFPENGRVHVYGDRIPPSEHAGGANDMVPYDHVIARQSTTMLRLMSIPRAQDTQLALALLLSAMEGGTSPSAFRKPVA